MSKRTHYQVPGVHFAQFKPIGLLSTRGDALGCGEGWLEMNFADGMDVYFLKSELFRAGGGIES